MSIDLDFLEDRSISLENVICDVTCCDQNYSDFYFPKGIPAKNTLAICAVLVADKYLFWYSVPITSLVVLGAGDHFVDDFREAQGTYIPKSFEEYQGLPIAVENRRSWSNFHISRYTSCFDLDVSVYWYPDSNIEKECHLLDSVFATLVGEGAYSPDDNVKRCRSRLLSDFHLEKVPEEFVSEDTEDTPEIRFGVVGVLINKGVESRFVTAINKIPSSSKVDYAFRETCMYKRAIEVQLVRAIRAHGCVPKAFVGFVDEFDTSLLEDVRNDVDYETLVVAYKSKNKSVKSVFDSDRVNLPLQGKQNRAARIDEQLSNLFESLEDIQYNDNQALKSTPNKTLKPNPNNTLKPNLNKTMNTEIKHNELNAAGDTATVTSTGAIAIFVNGVNPYVYENNTITPAGSIMGDDSIISEYAIPLEDVAVGDVVRIGHKLSFVQDVNVDKKSITTINPADNSICTFAIPEDAMFGISMLTVLFAGNKAVKEAAAVIAPLISQYGKEAVLNAVKFVLAGGRDTRITRESILAVIDNTRLMGEAVTMVLPALTGAVSGNGTGA